MTDPAESGETSDPVVERLARLELTLLELVTTLGLLVGDVAERPAGGLDRPDSLEGALDRAWQTLFDPERPDPSARSRDVVADWAEPVRLRRIAADALHEAMRDTGAAVGAIYATGEDEVELVAWEGYPPEVMEDYRHVPLDADLPVCAAARSRRPLWFAASTQIVDRYPHLRAAHEQTEATLGLTDVQGAVMPLLANDRVGAVVILGFADSAAPRKLDEVRGRIVRALTTA